jgi:hypothetical protein
MQPKPYTNFIQLAVTKEEDWRQMHTYVYNQISLDHNNVYCNNPQISRH